MARFSTGLGVVSVYHASSACSMRARNCIRVLPKIGLRARFQIAEMYGATPIDYLSRPASAEMTTEMSSPLPASDVSLSQPGRRSATVAGPSCWMLP